MQTPTTDTAKCNVGDGVTAAGKYTKQQKQTNKRSLISMIVISKLHEDTGFAV